jgi:hypothetical protein
MGTAIALPLALVLANPVAGPAALPVVPPAAAGMSAVVLARIDTVVLDSIARKDAPGPSPRGAEGRVVFRKAYGRGPSCRPRSR